MGTLAFNQIRLAGFKSFVDATDFVIEPGLTGIVGPNGCGKSNLLEAIRWVMGANSAKAMRGAAMDDVIFNGTKQRPGRNQAQVLLTIDNKARMAPPMFNDDDILEVARIITKGKGSTYKVNGKTVRAKDVQLLFADASTGANSPALVRQGQINELISAKPSSRRRILEEAAGISGLHTRRHEAELRLRAAETNLSRLDDVIAQIESQILSLRRQARQATRYRRLAGEIHEYRSLLWLKRWQDSLDALKSAQDAKSHCETQVQELSKAASESIRLAAELSEKLDPRREEQLIAAAVLARLNAAKDALESEESSAKSNIEKLTFQLEQIAGDIDRESGITEDAARAEARLSEEFDALSSAGDNDAAVDAAEQQARQAAQTRTELEQRYSDITRKIADRSARKDAAQRDVERGGQRLQRTLRERAEVKDKLAALENNSAAQSSGNLFISAAAEALTALDTARQNEQKLAQDRSHAEKQDQTARDKLAEERQGLGRLTAERDALHNILQTAGQGDWKAVLGEMKVKAGYETALAAALGDDLDGSLEEGAPLRWAGADTPRQDLPKDVTPLSDLVKAPAALTARLSQIGVIDNGSPDLYRNQLKAGQRLVTKQGHVLRWDGFEVRPEAETAAAKRLQQQNRLTALDHDIQQHQSRVEAAQSAFDSARDARQNAVNIAQEARRALPDLEKRERAAQAAVGQYEADIAREAAQKSALEDRLTRLDMEHNDVQGQYDRAQTLLAEFESGEDLSAESEALRAELLKAREIADDASAAYRSLKRELEARAARRAAIETERGNWKKRGQTASERIANLENRRGQTETALTDARRAPDQFEDRRQALMQELSDAETRRKTAADGLAEAETTARDADIAARAAETAHAQAREARAAAAARLEAAQNRMSENEARISETLESTPDELSSHLGELSPESKLSENDIERKLERLNRERESLGGVNLRADEEVIEQEERLTAMNDERQDLIAAIARLREGIDELNSEGRQRLLAAFDEVNGHFGRLFTTLFGGGEASLALTESDDPLEAGLEVMVSPPGKKLGSMSLMSGGEQALTATALIFAVFLSNPAPICVLDEVDAPLDDANVSRYCNLLDEMTKQTQTKFIAITHNPVTMSRMDRIFGVTMAEQGVSQLLSMQLTDAERLVAAE